MTEVAIWSTLKHNVYVVLVGWNDNKTATFKAYINPLVKWIWIGGGVLALGTMICVFPDRRHSESSVPNY